VALRDREYLDVGVPAESLEARGDGLVGPGGSRPLETQRGHLEGAGQEPEDVIGPDPDTAVGRVG